MVEKKKQKAVAKKGPSTGAKRPEKKEAKANTGPAKEGKAAEARPKKKAGKIAEKGKQIAVKKQAKTGKVQKGKKRKPRSKEIKAFAKKVKSKRRFMFRGRFGNRRLRRISDKKWQKWRKPRGIDIYFKQEDGLYPKTGYRTAKEIRGRHPSGYRIVRVTNEADLELAVGKDMAVVFAGTLGKRKRILLLDKAEKKGIEVLNG